jgi:regulator of replication initiation timing
MNETSRTNGECQRAEELIEYLYGEASEAQSKSFERHLQTCAVCRDELAAFRGVRARVGVWHNAVLENAAPLPTLNFETTPLAQTAPNEISDSASANQATTRKRSALAALREFFALAPLWMQAGSFAALALVCLLGALAVTNAEVRWDNTGIAFHTGVYKSKNNTTEKADAASNENAALREQLKNLTAERAALQAERDELRGNLEQTKNQLAAQTNTVQTLNAALENAKNNQRSAKPRVVYITLPVKNRSLYNGQRIYSAGVENEERDVPRLIDLIGDSK